MRIASLVVRAAPDFVDVLAQSLPGIPGVEVHGSSRDEGRLVVSVEDGEGYSMADSLIAVNMAPHVQGVTMAYEYTDEGLELSAQEA
jgi:nitrate reductase NapD